MPKVIENDLPFVCFSCCQLSHYIIYRISSFGYIMAIIIQGNFQFLGSIFPFFGTPMWMIRLIFFIITFVLYNKTCSKNIFGPCNALKS